jgi:hypothetical protein
MTNTTKKPAITVSDIAGCVESTLDSLAENGKDFLDVTDVETIKRAARNVAIAAIELKSALRVASEIMEEQGIDIPDFPRFEY